MRRTAATKILIDTANDTIVGAHMLGPDYAGVPTAVFTIPELVRVGLLEDEAAAAGIDVDVRYKDTGGWYSNYRIGETTAATKILIDTANDTITVEAGCVLEAVQQAAHEHGRLFPLSFAAEGSATIGGNLATNACGVQVLRYGNARDLVLGLEVVLPDGRIWNGLRSWRKDNSGYDLKHLFIGAEGTLGIISRSSRACR